MYFSRRDQPFSSTTTVARVCLPLAVAVIGVLGLAACAAEPPATPSTPAPPAAASPAPPTEEPPTSDELIVTDFESDTVTFVDPEVGATGSVVVGTAPYGVAVDDAGNAWVTTAEGVAVVDTRSRERTALIPYGVEVGPATFGEYRGGGMGIALSPDGKRVYAGVNIPDANGAVTVIDAATREVTGTVDVGLRPFDVDVAADGSQVYATNHDSFDVSVIDAATLETQRFEVAPFGTEGGLASWLKPHYAAVRGDGKLLLPFEGQRLAVLDPSSGAVVIEPLTANTHQHGATITSDGRLLIVGTGPIGDASGAPSLTVRHPDGHEMVVALDGPHENVTVSSDEKTAYVSGGFTRDGWWNGLTVVDLDTGDTRRLEAGTRPLGIAVVPGT